MITEKNESRKRPSSTKGQRSELLEKHSSSAGLASQLKKDSSKHVIDSVVRQNLASVIEHGSERKSLSETLLEQDSNSLPTKISLRRQFDHHEEYNPDVRIDKLSEDESSFPQVNTNSHYPPSKYLYIVTDNVISFFSEPVSLLHCWVRPCHYDTVLVIAIHSVALHVRKINFLLKSQASYVVISTRVHLMHLSLLSNHHIYVYYFQ